jgi:Zn-dependent peptidase ImmA (M78 family)
MSDVGARIRGLLAEARVLGVAPAELAGVGITPEMTAAAERGDLAGWTTASAARLTRLLGYDDAVVYGDAAPTGPVQINGFRGDRSLSGAVRRLFRGILSVHEILGIGAPATPRTAARAASQYDKGYELARWLRRRYRVPAEPIRDLVAWVEHAGAAVWTITLGTPGYLGATILGPDAAAVVIDRSLLDQPLLFRRTLAHEACHALFDRLPRSAAATLEAEEAEETDATDPDAREQRARAFTAELLIPLAGLSREKHASTPGEARELITRVAQRFGAPRDLTRYHLINHGLLHEDAPAGSNLESTEWQEKPGDLVPSRLRRAILADAMGTGRAREILDTVPGGIWRADALAS